MAFDLERFVAAQRGIYDQALGELRAGRKQSHWIWFVFPQLAGLGRSETARFNGISGAAEARAYLAHPLLGRRLRECAEALLAHAGQRPEAILGSVDALKLRSSMTLFEAVAADPAPFVAVLDAFFGGERDAATLNLLDG
jgi:uncharacterized protein (DUF1810 family)